MKRGKTILLLLLVCLVGMLAWLLSGGPTSDEAADRRERILPDFYASTVTRMELTNKFGRFVLEREPEGSWRIAEPRELPADEDAVQRLLEALELTQRVDAAIPRRAVQDPVVRVKLLAEGEARGAWSLDIGQAHAPGAVPITTQTTTLAAPLSLLNRLKVRLYDLRTKNLARPVDISDVQRISVHREDRKRNFRAVQEGAWVTSNMRERLSPTALAEALRPVWNYQIQPEDIVPANAPEARMRPADYPNHLKLELGSGTQTWMWTTDEPALFATREEPGIYRLPGSVAESLAAIQVEQLVDTMAARFRPETVARIVVGTGPDAFYVRRHGARWMMGDGTDHPADRKIVEQFLKELSEAPVDTSKRLRPPREGMVELQIMGEEEGQMVLRDRVELAGSGAGLAVRRPPATAVHPLEPAEFLGHIPLSKSGFMERTVLREPAPLALRVRLEHGAEVTVAHWSRKERRWRLAEPVVDEADRQAVDYVLELFGELRALRFVDTVSREDRQALEQYGLSSPRVKLAAIFYDATDRTYNREIAFGNTLGDEVYARISEDDRVFTLPRELLRGIPRNLASRVLSRTDELRRYVISSGSRVAGASISEDGKWKTLDGDPVESGSPRSDAVELLSDFTAKEIAAWETGSGTQYGLRQPRMVVQVDEAMVKGKRILVGAPHPDGGYYATGPTSRYVLVISDEQYETLHSLLP